MTPPHLSTIASSGVLKTMWNDEEREKFYGMDIPHLFARIFCQVHQTSSENDVLDSRSSAALVISSKGRDKPENIVPPKSCVYMS